MWLSNLIAALFGRKAQPSAPAEAPAPTPIAPEAASAKTIVVNAPTPAPIKAETEPLWLQLCRPLTKHFESCYLIAYCDPASPRGKALRAAGLWSKYLLDRSVDATYRHLSGGPWTIGYGATGVGITEGCQWTQYWADNDLTRRLLAIGAQIDRAVQVPLLPNQKAAIVDWVYNLGEGNLLSSTMLKCLNANNFSAAMDELVKWDKAGGEELAGLLTRRQAERKLFSSGVWQ